MREMGLRSINTQYMYMTYSKTEVTDKPNTQGWSLTNEMINLSDTAK